MRRRKEKEYWVKRSERIPDSAGAKSRKAQLRHCEHVAYVRLDKDGADYVISYSVARWYLEELRKAALKL